VSAARARTPAGRRAGRADPDTHERVRALVDSLESRDRALLSLVLIEELSLLEAGASLRTPSRDASRRLAELLAHFARRTRAGRSSSRRAA